MDENKVVVLTLLRWGKRVNARGPLGRRLLRAYIREGAALQQPMSPGITFPRAASWSER